MRKTQLLSIVFIVGLIAAAAPGFAQTPTPGTPTPPSTATPVTTPPAPTATPTPLSGAVSFDDANLTAGQPVTASGAANDGSYCLAMVQAGVFSIGDPYSGTPVSRVDLTVSGGSFSGVTVNNSAPTGQFDLLLLIGPCTTVNIILAGDRLDAGWGLDVAAGTAIQPSPKPAVSWC